MNEFSCNIHEDSMVSIMTFTTRWSKKYIGCGGCGCQMHLQS